jgi:phosphate:Na+ symporter
LKNPANAMGIAEIHSLFNIGATFDLLPCTKLLEKLAYLTIPQQKQEAVEQTENDFNLLDVRFLEKPAFAVEQCRNVAVHMSELAKEALFKAIGLLDNYEQPIADEVRFLEDKVDKYEDELGTYLVKLSSKHLSEKDSRTLSIILHCIGDFERISDHAMNIMQSAKEINEKKIQFSEEALKELEVFTRALKEIVSISMEAFEKEDINLSITVEPLEEVIDYLNENIKKRHVERLTTGKCTIELGFTLSDILNNFERVSDHCSNIAVCLIQTNEKNFDIHEYISKVKGDNNEAFKAQYKKYIETYLLP